MADVRIKSLVVDVLKPREISIVDLSKAICNTNGAENVSIDVKEVDANTETVSIRIHGYGIDYTSIVSTIDEYGCAIRSIDGIEVFKPTKTKV